MMIIAITQQVGKTASTQHLVLLSSSKQKSIECLKGSFLISTDKMPITPARDVNIHPNPPLIAPLIAPQCNINQSIKDGIFVIITQTILLLRITHINTNTIITGLTVVCISDTTTHSRMRVVWIGETQNHVLHKIISVSVYWCGDRCGDRLFTLLSVALLYITLTTTA